MMSADPDSVIIYSNTADLLLKMISILTSKEPDMFVINHGAMLSDTMNGTPYPDIHNSTVGVAGIRVTIVHYWGNY